MMDSVEHAVNPEARLLEQAVDNPSLGLIVFDGNREVVFCNKRYMEIGFPPTRRSREPRSAS